MSNLASVVNLIEALHDSALKTTFQIGTLLGRKPIQNGHFEDLINAITMGDLKSYSPILSFDKIMVYKEIRKGTTNANLFVNYEDRCNPNSILFRYKGKIPIMEEIEPFRGKLHYHNGLWRVLSQSESEHLKKLGLDFYIKQIKEKKERDLALVTA